MLCLGSNCNNITYRKLNYTHNNIQKMQKDNKHSIINSISYNSDNTLLSIATNSGFKVYTTSPPSLKQ